MTPMKIKFDIECTPEEARAFMGLPDVAPMQEKMMKELEERLSENIRSLDPETMLKTWLPATMEGWGQMQKMFWNQMGTPEQAANKSSTKK
jgi:tetrahydromethanopterin S-methyltransferase subunit B